MRRTRILLLTVAATVILGGVSLISLGMRSDGAPGSAAPATARGTTTGPATGTAAAAPTSRQPDRAALAQQDRSRRVTALDAALKKYAATAPEFSVAVLDRRTGERYSFRGTERYHTASIVKVQVLACLLLTAQDEDRDLSATELSQAKLMIRISDNNAATALFNRLGRAAAITRCNRRLGLTETTVNQSWGLTLTTVHDQVKLLAKLVDKAGPLDAGSRKLADQLMSTVRADQDWGVSAAARSGERFTIKNGWLLRAVPADRWIINSDGRITGAGVDVSLAVLSHGHASQDAGMAMVEKVAKLTRSYLKY